MREYFNIKQSNSSIPRLVLAIRKNGIYFWILFLLLGSSFVLLLDVKKVKVLESVKSEFADAMYGRSLLYNISLIFNKKAIEDQQSARIVNGIELEKSNQENEQLKKLLNFVQVNQIPQNKIATSQIIGNITGHSLIIRRTENDTLQKDQLVFNEFGLVGKITDVNDNFVRVMLITHSSFKIPAIGLKSENRFVASGTNGKSLKPLLISGQLEEGEMVLSTMGNIKLPIGRFDFKTKSIIPFNSSTKLNNVTILLEIYQ